MFHRHRWIVVSTGLYQRSIAWMPNSDSDVTLVLYKCEGCGRHRTEEVNGHWTKEQLTA